MKNLFCYAVLLLFCITSCTNEPHRNPKVHSYKTHGSSGGDEWMYWYIIYNANGSCYYTSSANPVSNFSTCSWTSSGYSPVANMNDVEEMESVVVNEADLSPDIQTDIAEHPGDFTLETEVAADPGGTENPTSSDGWGAGDSGSGDTGGGDSGGGDGGGGE